ncbi:MAG TPA: hypothetical protein VHT25_07375 [Solirubrobacteraceae bacterium]|nr:hypothetical protein [Solirubrobacteraceae bacterium]
MSKVKRIVGIKATKAAAGHSTRGLSAKVHRRPLRAVSLLSAGIALGLAGGWALGRATAGRS